MSNAAKLNCPTCKILIQWDEQYPHRPFCSARCKQIDFGDWANETHTIAGESAVDLELLEETQH